MRSHYDRRDIERLFELQPRAAQKLIEMLPHQQLGASKLMEREGLLSFLDRVHKADDVPALLVEIRSANTQTSRRRIRSLVRRDLEPAALTSLPASMTLRRGRLQVDFRTVEELAEAMLVLARILESEGEAFAQAYERPADQLPAPEADEVRALFAELKDLEDGRSC